jgi:hypothetical protein
MKKKKGIEEEYSNCNSAFHQQQQKVRPKIQKKVCEGQKNTNNGHHGKTKTGKWNDNNSAMAILFTSKCECFSIYIPMSAFIHGFWGQ